MKTQQMMTMMEEVARPEHLVWYQDLVQEMTGAVPVVRQTTVPKLIDGRYWQVPQVVASVPAFVSLAGFSYEAVRVAGATEEEALRALCECVHALLWDLDVFVMPVSDEHAWQMAGAV